MKLYKCKMLDESMPDWEECIVAVMENEQEQNLYYNSDNRTEVRKTLMKNSGYDYEHYDIEFWFPYEKYNYDYANKIAKNISQSACDADYADFKYIHPQSR